MTSYALATIDLGPYLTAPNLTIEATFSLGNDLIALMPDDPPELVAKAGGRLGVGLTGAQKIFVERVAAAGSDLGTEVAFDFAYDRFWNAAEHQCDCHINYRHEGLDMLSDEQKQQMGFEHKRELAEHAAELHQHLFSDGRSFLGKPFPQQVALTGSRLEFIKTAPNSAAYIEIIGKGLFTTLQVMQAGYEDMVRSRAARSDTSADLRVLRLHLARLITRYNGAVITTMLDDEEPETWELVQTILRPMITSRSA